MEIEPVKMLKSLFLVMAIVLSGFAIHHGYASYKTAMLVNSESSFKPVEIKSDKRKVLTKKLNKNQEKTIATFEANVIEMPQGEIVITKNPEFGEIRIPTIYLN